MFSIVYLTSAVVLASFASSAPLSKNISHRNSADAATLIQDSESYLVCQVALQSKTSAFALGIGEAPVDCVDPKSSAVVEYPIITSTPLFKPTEAKTRATSTIPTPPPSLIIKEIETPTPTSTSTLVFSTLIRPIVSPTPSPSAVTPICSSTDATVCAFQAEALLAHNTARAIHHASPLVWNDTLAEGALEWIQKGLWKHSGGSLFPFVYGENFFASTIGYPYTIVTNAVTAFMNEEPLYDYSNPGFSEETGHFTQVVWKNSQQGCAAINVDLDVFSQYTNSSSSFSCIYTESGNYIGEFAENVQAP